MNLIVYLLPGNESDDLMFTNTFNLESMTNSKKLSLEHFFGSPS